MVSLKPFKLIILCTAGLKDPFNGSSGTVAGDTARYVTKLNCYRNYLGVLLDTKHLKLRYDSSG